MSQENNKKQVNSTVFDHKQHFVVNIFKVVCDSVIVELDKRSKIYKTVVDEFEFLFNLSILESNKCIVNICKKYKNDLDVNSLKNETVQFCCIYERGKCCKSPWNV